MSRPHPMGDVRTHLTLFRTMAAETGADPVRAFDEGRLDPVCWAEAVNRCRDCRWVEGCRRWLAVPADRPRAVPSGCANGAMLTGLRAEA
ncbi:MAG: DUF6455 family protein [Pseudomonadota bacterium]